MTQLNSLRESSFSSKLQLKEGDSAVVHFDSTATKLPATQLDFQSDEGLNLGISSLNESSTTAKDKISVVFSEIQKESKIESIQDKVSSGYVSLRDKHLSSSFEDQSKYLEEFNKTNSQVEKWSKTKDKFASATALTQSQRTSLQKVYELHDALKNESKSLKDELKRYGDLPELKILAQKQDAPSSTTIKASLEAINWQGDKVKAQKSPTSTQFFNSRDWGSWNENPYKVFYSREQDWKSDISKSNKNARELHKIDQSIARLNSMVLISWGPRVQKHIREETEKANKIKSKMHSHIELQVAHKLLRYMNAPKT